MGCVGARPPAASTIRSAGEARSASGNIWGRSGRPADRIVDTAEVLSPHRGDIPGVSPLGRAVHSIMPYPGHRRSCRRRATYNRCAVGIVQLNQIRNNVLESVGGLVDVSDVQKDQEIARLTRGLAAWVIMQVGELTPEEAAAGVTDGFKTTASMRSPWMPRAA